MIMFLSHIDVASLGTDDRKVVEIYSARAISYIVAHDLELV